MATQINLYPDQGSKFEHIFLYRDKATGAAIPLTGGTVECQIRPFPQSSDILFDADNAAKGNVEITDGPNGEVTLTIPGADSAAWREDEAHYDIKVTLGGDPFRIAEGVVFINKQTTR